MPHRFERHGASKPDWWGAEPARHDQIRDAAEEDTAASDVFPLPSYHSHKKTRTWCKGKTGIPHVPELTVRAPCHWEKWACCCWRPKFSRVSGLRNFSEWWDCRHRETCTRCGKILRESWELKDTECPDYPGDSQQKAAAAAEAEEWWMRDSKRTYGRKPVITGPQGYRRSRPDPDTITKAKAGPPIRLYSNTSNRWPPSALGI